MTELDPKMRVGLRIKELRGELGMSQEAFAYSIEMSRTYFAEVETGKRNVSIENIDRIARGPRRFPEGLFRLKSVCGALRHQVEVALSVVDPAPPVRHIIVLTRWPITVPARNRVFGVRWVNLQGVIAGLVATRIGQLLR